jgi:hypothetical protein
MKIPISAAKKIADDFVYTCSSCRNKTPCRIIVPKAISVLIQLGMFHCPYGMPGAGWKVEVKMKRGKK